MGDEQFFTIEFEPQVQRAALDPYPGSPEAQLMACNCPSKQPLWPRVTLNITCPIHKATKRKAS